MTFSKKLFVAIDKIFDANQNRRRMTKYADKQIVVNTDIVYNENNEQYCKLDTYHIEKKEGKYPVLFYIHGGGFVAGDKYNRRALARWSATLGYFVVNLNYSLAPEYLFPTPVQDLLKAMNWVQNNAEKLNLDLEKMIVSGDSAGGYYSAMLACISTNKALQDQLGVATSVRFHGAILNCGIYDVGIAMKRNMPFDLTGKICFDFTGIHKEQFDSYEWKNICTPSQYLTKDFPATFLTYAKKDIFCKGQGEEFGAKLREAGIYVEEFASEKLLQNHCFSLTWKGKAQVENNRQIENFMRRFAEGGIK